MTEHPALKYAALIAERQARWISEQGCRFMFDRAIDNPRDVTAVYVQSPGFGCEFSHFEHTPFNDHGANI